MQDSTKSKKSLTAKAKEEEKQKKPLTAIAVKKHKEGFLVDRAPHEGLRLKANKNGTKTWIYRYKNLKGTLSQIKLGDYPSMELAEARAAFLVQRGIRRKGLDPREFAKRQKADEELARIERERTDLNFSRMVEEYLVEMVEKNRRTKDAREARCLLEKNLGDLGGKNIKGVTPEELHMHIISIRNHAPDTARRFRAELKAAWNYSLSTGKTNVYCPINPQVGGKIVQGKRVRVLSEGELKLLLPWMGNYSSAVADALRLTLYLGLRSGEVCGMHDREISEEGDGYWLTIPAERMKKGRLHRVPLVGTVLEIVLARMGNGYLFPSRAGGCMRQKVLGVEVYAHSGASDSPIYKNKDICPVSDWAPNDLRKTARTELARLGCSYEVSESILAHKIPGVSGLYNQYEYKDEKRLWLGKLSELLNSLV